MEALLLLQDIIPDRQRDKFYELLRSRDWSKNPDVDTTWSRRLSGFADQDAARRKLIKKIINELIKELDQLGRLANVKFRGVLSIDGQKQSFRVPRGLRSTLGKLIDELEALMALISPRKRS
jgi:hypothetical protein